MFQPNIFVNLKMLPAIKTLNIILQSLHFRLLSKQYLETSFTSISKIKFPSEWVSFNYYLYFLYFQLALETSKNAKRGPDPIELNREIFLKVKSCGLQGGHEPSLFPGSKGDKYPAGLYQQCSSQQAARSDPSSILSICGTELGVLSPVLEPPI